MDQPDYNLISFSHSTLLLDRSSEASLSYQNAKWPAGNDELIEANQMQIFRQKKSIGKPGGSDGKTMTINQANFNTELLDRARLK